MRIVILARMVLERRTVWRIRRTLMIRALVTVLGITPMRTVTVRCVSRKDRWLVLHSGHEDGTRLHSSPLRLGSGLNAKLFDGAEDNTTFDDPCDYHGTGTSMNEDCYGNDVTAEWTTNGCCVQAELPRLRSSSWSTGLLVRRILILQFLKEPMK